MTTSDLSLRDGRTDAVARAEDLSRQIRIGSLTAIQAGGSGHPGGSLSCADLLGALFATRIDAAALIEDRTPRNRVILSKGHAAPALYAAFAATGVIAPEELATLRQLGSRLQGHPDRAMLREVEMSTGSLGIGLSAGVGLAWHLQQNAEPYGVYVILGDGELNEGQIWEAVSFAGAHALRPLVAIVDANGAQNDGRVEDVLDLRPYAGKFEQFRWSAREIDGHDQAAILEALDWADAAAGPAVIVAHTHKGKGVSFIEDKPDWHSHTISVEQLALATAEVLS